MSCLNLLEFAFDEWGDILLKPLNGGRYPLAGEFELTNRCNLTCKHCYINQPAVARQALATDNSILRIPLIDLAFHFTIIIGLAAEHMKDSRRINWQSAGNRIIPVFRS